MNALTDTELGDGIYFNLPAEVYHQDHALGSGDMKRLARNPVSWWFNSKLNPLRPHDRTTPAMLFGQAAHSMIIEGRQSFESRFARMEHSGAVKAGKEERAAALAAGKAPLPGEDYDRVLVASTYIISDPELNQAFQGGAGETSVFWTANGIRKKCRFDYLKVRSVIDLKSTREQDELDFAENCKRLIARNSLYVQLAHYAEGRDAMSLESVTGGDLPVFGDHDAVWLGRVRENMDWSWVWVFYQSGGAPETWGCYTDRQSKLYAMGESQVRLAEHNYKTFGVRFGYSGVPWIVHRSLERYMEDEQPEWVWR